MEWWQVVSLLAGTIVGGTAFFILVCCLAALFEREPQMTVLGALASVFTSTKPEVPSVVEEQPKSADRRLMDEVDNNLRVTSEFWTGDLVPFDTRVWDEQQYQLYQLPTNLRNELLEVYADINLANHIVWFSKEFNRGSPRLIEGYAELRTRIAERLQRIMQELE
jgi:hypothetical protein